MRRPPSGVLNARRAEAAPLEPLDELWLRTVAVPAALVVAALFSRIQLGHVVQRMLFGMPLHELGHAFTALALGFPAFPLPWFAPMAESRSPGRAALGPPDHRGGGVLGRRLQLVGGAPRSGRDSARADRERRPVRRERSGGDARLDRAGAGRPVPRRGGDLPRRARAGVDLPRAPAASAGAPLAHAAERRSPSRGRPSFSPRATAVTIRASCSTPSVSAAGPGWRITELLIS